VKFARILNKIALFEESKHHRNRRGIFGLAGNTAFPGSKAESGQKQTCFRAYIKILFS
jgi:hypothetical protein